MISLKETSLLYNLAKNHYTNSGVIIDAGSFLGASTYALAAGVNENTLINREKVHIHSYDLFEANDEYVINYLQNVIFSKRDQFGHVKDTVIEVSKGFNYKFVFDFQIQRFAKYVKAYQGDICSYLWDRSDVEILFIDIAKTLDINRHIINNFFLYLIPGRSIVIQQDFHHPWHPYIHVTMQYLKEYFEIIISRVDNSRVYKYIQEIEPKELEKVIRYDFSSKSDSKFTLIDKSADITPRSVISPKFVMLSTLFL